MLNQDKKNEQKFVHFPKKVHKILLRNAVRDCIISEHLSVITPGNLLFTSLNSAFWLMGLNAYKVSPQLFNEFSRILSRYKLAELDSIDDKTLEQTAKKIIKEWKEIITIFNLKNETYAN